MWHFNTFWPPSLVVLSLVGSLLASAQTLPAVAGAISDRPVHRPIVLVPMLRMRSFLAVEEINAVAATWPAAGWWSSGRRRQARRGLARAMN
jgi:hypothetical protein